MKITIKKRIDKVIFINKQVRQKQTEEALLPTQWCGIMFLFRIFVLVVNRRLELLQDIGFQRDDAIVEVYIVISNGLDAIHLLELSGFKGKGILRRLFYEQGDNYLHRFKLFGTDFTKRRPADEIVQNVSFLLETLDRNPQCLREFFIHIFRNFYMEYDES